MIRREGDRMRVSGALTLASVAAALDEGNAAIANGVRSVDLGEVGDLDSSALALLGAGKNVLGIQVLNATLSTSSDCSRSSYSA